MKTNKKQNYVLFACAGVVALMLLFPPHYGGGGHGFLFAPNLWYVNIGMLLTQWVGVLIIGGILLLALRDKE